jgi:ketosteroid isomerase-like protein
VEKTRGDAGLSGDRIKLAQEAVDAWNRRDADWVIANSVPDIEFLPAVAGSLEGETQRVVRGRDGFRRFFSDLDETWEQFEIEAEEFREVGDALVTLCRVHAKGRASGLELDQPMAMVSWLRGDKFARAQSFLDLDEALEAAREQVVA